RWSVFRRSVFRRVQRGRPFPRRLLQQLIQRLEDDVVFVARNFIHPTRQTLIGGRGFIPHFLFGARVLRGLFPLVCVLGVGRLGLVCRLRGRGRELELLGLRFIEAGRNAHVALAVLYPAGQLRHQTIEGLDGGGRARRG